MILEAAALQVKPGESQAFEAAFREAADAAGRGAVFRRAG